jgi:hypothetical protein
LLREKTRSTAIKKWELPLRAGWLARAAAPSPAGAPGPPDEVPAVNIDQIEVKPYVSGLVKSFERKAA